MSADPIRQAHDKLMQQASDQGKLLEAGFIALQAVALHGASLQALETARLIYMAGAQHLWASMFAVLDPNHEPTMHDMRRMAMLSAELDAVTPQLNALAAGRKGTVQ